MQSMHLLLAEDDLEHQRLLRRSLAFGGRSNTVEVVSCRAELLAAVAAQAFDCVILDYSMPPHTASELIQEILPSLGSTPIIVISSSEEQRVVVEALRTGVADYVPKHEAISGSVLIDRVELVVRAARARVSERRREDRRLMKLERQAETDPLTGLHNRRYAARILNSDRIKSDRRAHMAMIMIDLDRFKSVNDTLGHHVGDGLLRQVADLLRRRATGSDCVIRWGGEEFMVLKPSASLSEAWIWADDVRRSMPKELVLPPDTDLPPVTGSFGVDAIPIAELSEDAIVRVDRAMYLAKESGRNRVCTWAMDQAISTAQEIQTDRMLTPRAKLVELIRRLRQSLGPVQLQHTGEHGCAVRRLSHDLGVSLGLDAEQLEVLDLAAEFHDIGKVAIPEAVLALPRSLSDGERRLVAEHSRFGAELMRTCGIAEEAAQAVSGHHVRWQERAASQRDQTTPNLADIIAAADALVTMISRRPYAMQRTVTQALAEVRQQRGRQFGPEVVDSMTFLDQNARKAA